MVIGLSPFTSVWPNKNSRTERRCDRPIFLDRSRVGKKSVTDPVNVRRCAPSVNALCATNLMRRRAVAAVCADNHRRVDFAPEVLQESGKQKDCARYVMGELA